jgi:serine/threonine protein kinase
MVEVGGRYSLMKRLGVGGMGEVWKAHDRLSGRTVAVKVLRTDIAGAPAAELRFQREIKATARLQGLHGVVPVIDAGSDPKVGLYFVMTLEVGLPMHEAWRHWDHWLQAWPYIEQLLDTLAGAHALGVIHRDIKPDNIFIKSDGDAVLLDFGVARLKDQARSGTSKYDMLGTVEYAAPEQATGARRRIGPWTDLYCFGIVLWEMICGRVPFQASTAIQSLMIRLENTCPPLDPRPGFAIPVGLDAVLQKMLNPLPGDRLVHAVDVRNAFAKLAEGPFEVRTPARPDEPVPSSFPREQPTDDEANRLLAKREARLAYGSDGSLITSPLQCPIPRMPFVGRDRMLLTLSRALDQWWRNPRLGVLVVSGPRGTGKSRLVQELVTPFLAAAQIDGHRHRWTQGRSMREVALTIVSGIGLPDEGLREQADWFLRLHGVHDATVRGRLVDWIRGRSPVDPNAEARLFTRMLKACAQRRPYVLMIDGLHQLNPDVLRLVDAVRARELPMLVILISRDPRPPEGTRQPSWVSKATWTLEPLNTADIDRMLSEVVDLPDSERFHMVQSSRGNPGRLSQNIGSAGTTSELVPAWPRWIVPPADWHPPSPFDPSRM